MQIFSRGFSLYSSLMFLILFHLMELPSIRGSQNGLSSHSYSTFLCVQLSTKGQKSRTIELPTLSRLSLTQIGSATCFKWISCIKQTIKYPWEPLKTSYTGPYQYIMLLLPLFSFSRSSKYHGNFISDCWFRSGRGYKFEWNKLRCCKSKYIFFLKWWNGWYNQALI